MKRLGIIGGLGPMATAYFMQLVILMTDAVTDQEHIEMIIYNNPRTPDRTAYILGQSQQSPVEEMVRMGRQLAAQDCEALAIPCMTAHYFHAELEEQIKVPVVHGIRKTAQYLQERGIRNVGVMATDGTISSGIFQKELQEAGINSIVPDKEYQQKVMELIYEDVKAGRKVDMEKFYAVSQHLRLQGADVIVLGCTELSVIKRDEQIGADYLDALDVLAQSCVLSCGKLKDEYKELITTVS